MANRPDRAAMAANLQNRAQQSYESKDQGMSFTNFFKTEANLPLWSPAKDESTIDIVPYPAGKDDPAVRRGQIKADDWTYVLDIWIHRNIGARNLQVPCLEQNFKESCPICDYRSKLRKEDPEDARLKELSPKRRVAYNVIVCFPREETKKGMRVFEISHFFMEKEIAAIAKISKHAGEGYVPFSDPSKNGKSITFTKTVKKGKDGQDNVEFIGFKFEDRNYEITDEELDSAYILDQYVHYYTAPEIDEILRDAAKAPEGGRGGHEDGRGRGRGEDHSSRGTADEEAQVRSRRDRPDSGRGEAAPAAPAAEGRGRGREDESPPKTGRRMEPLAAPVTPAPGKLSQPVCPGKLPDGTLGTFGLNAGQCDECEKCGLWPDCLKLSDIAKEHESSTHGEAAPAAPAAEGRGRGETEPEARGRRGRRS